jgi:hypothetical protein
MAEFVSGFESGDSREPQPVDKVRVKRVADIDRKLDKLLADREAMMYYSNTPEGGVLIKRIDKRIAKLMLEKADISPDNMA